MSEFKGTPGPWRFDGSSAIVAEDTTVVIGEYWVKVIPESDDPDWLLMAAAPELLEALQLARHLLKVHGVTLDWTGDTAKFEDLIIQREGVGPINMIDAAIAKALGETK